MPRLSGRGVGLKERGEAHTERRQRHRNPETEKGRKNPERPNPPSHGTVEEVEKHAEVDEDNEDVEEHHLPRTV